LTSEQVKEHSERIARGAPRAREGTSVAGHPFEHPHYWAAFVLIGDPD
jgi:CHAT domain-containing protein